MTNTFKSLSLNSKLLENLDSLGFHAMTPIQEAALPLVLDGLDVIAQAKTGSGKTATFGLGLLNNLKVEKSRVQSLVICPTRELAVQVAEELRRLARFIPNVKIIVVTGGEGEFRQINSLDHGGHIVVGTPGRLLKFLEKGILDVSEIETLVLDEADRMLDMGFEEDMRKIISQTPTDKQSLLFSATYPEEIMELSRYFQNNPKHIIVDSKHEKNIIRQVFIDVGEHQNKLDALVKVLGNYKPESTVIFCKTKQICSDVAHFLKSKSISALSFHGDLDQNERTVVLTKFSNKSTLILVATDVAARGLDIKDLHAVINFDLATDPEVYTHRIGRTARAGKEGFAFSFYVERESEKLAAIEDYFEVKNEYLNLADLKESEKFDLVPPMKTIYINGGKKDKIRKGDILGALINEAKITANDIGNISVLDKQSYVAIKKEFVGTVIDSFVDGKIKGRKYKVGLA